MEGFVRGPEELVELEGKQGLAGSRRAGLGEGAGGRGREKDGREVATDKDFLNWGSASR